ncbi:MAG TPA: LamG-like jellyroll fold domain-containing protein [Chthoniobacterales bacterium]|nr:LamG-like jellyroll fold domain-containing protein [Chthoniobacterales bacterium]
MNAASRFHGSLALLATTFLLAITTASAQTPNHLYDFNGSYADAFGGPAMVPDGGTLNPTNYTFAANQGLNLSNALANTGNYTVLIDFSFSNLSGYRKILDFKDRGPDAGLYNRSTELYFYPVVGGPAGAFVADTLARMVLTRDAVTNQITGYVNGVQQFSFTDSSGLGIFTGPNGIMRFFEDDFSTGGEASAGLVDRIALWDSVLSPAQVATLGGPGPIAGPTPPPAGVPEGGSTLVMFAAALLVIEFVRRRYALLCGKL